MTKQTETDKADQSNQDNSEYIKITVIENAIEAQLLSSILSEHNIPHRVHSFEDNTFNGLFQTNKGWGTCMAPSSFKDQVMEIVQAVRGT